MTESQDVKPRPEAQPLKWDELTGEQQRAAEQACTLLRELAKLDWEKPDKPQGVELFLPPIDASRVNHVILLDGGRGSGKTALLITLVNAWNWGVRGYDKKKFEPAPEFKELLKPAGQIVPVGLVDLQPLPASTNLMIHLVGQFQRLVEAIEQKGVTPEVRWRERPPWQDAEEDGPKCAARWREFLRAAASGWDGNLERRRANLDPEAYAVEVEEAGRKRLDVVTSFRAMIDALVDEYKVFQKTDDRPLFVVAIDDADMNPARSVELLELVRTLWHPRVAFVLTGYSELFLEMLKAHALYALKKPLVHLNVPIAKWREVFEAQDLAPDLAKDIYDKVIPPGQRCWLPALKPSDRFKLLEQSLRRLPAPEHPLRLQDLAEYFALQTQAQEALPDRLRLLLDLEQVILWRSEESKGLAASQREPKKQKLTIEILAMLSADQGVSPSIRPEEASEHAAFAFAAQNAASVTWKPARKQTVRLTPQKQIGFTFQYGFQVRGVENNEELSPEKVLSSLIACDATQGLRVPRLGLRGFVVRTACRTEDFDWCSFAWPLPAWNTFLHYASFARCWNEVTGLDREPEVVAPALVENISETARKYLATVLEYIQLSLDRAAVALDGVSAPLLKELQRIASQVRQVVPTWRELAERTAQIANIDSTQRPLAVAGKSWALCRAGLLAAPESGLASYDANVWFAALKQAFGGTWGAVSQSLYEQRLLRANIATEGINYDVSPNESRKKFLQGIDRSFPEHAWTKEIRPVRRDFSKRLSEKFSNILMNSENVPVRNMALYLTPKRLRAFDRASPTLKERWESDVVTFQEGRGTAPLIAAAMWKRAIETGEAPRLSIVKGALDLDLLNELYDRLGEDPWGHVEQEKVQLDDIGPRIRVKPAKWDWRNDTGFSRSLDGALFEFAWDVLIDTRDQDQSPTLPQAWWDAGGGRSDTKKDADLFSWPAVDWLSFLDHELLADAWNRSCSIAREASELAPRDASIGDDLAFWFVITECQIAWSRGGLQSWERGVTPKQWKDAITQIASKDYQQSRRGGRWASFAAWCRAVPLLAAPESGLSSEIAEVILKAAELSDTRREELRKLRRDRMFHRKPKGRPVEPELKRIDDEHPDHPWVRLIEQR